MDVVSAILEAGTPDGEMAVLRKVPAGQGPFPKVVMFHDGPGIRRATHEFAVKLAGQGYDVLVPDLYHREGRMIGFEPEERERDPSLVERMRGLLASVSDDGIQADLDATLELMLVGGHEKLGTIGFCMGARAVFRSVTRLPGRFAAAAAWHPSFLVDQTGDSPHLRAHSLTTPFYIGIGDADQVQSIEMQRLFFDAVADLDFVEVDVLPGADHGFTWPGSPNYDENAATVCFAKTTELFGREIPR